MAWSLDEERCPSQIPCVDETADLRRRLVRVPRLAGVETAWLLALAGQFEAEGADFQLADGRILNRRVPDGRAMGGRLRDGPMLDEKASPFRN
jgi:hypothetical protein